MTFVPHASQSVDEQAEREYAARRCDEQELLDRYPGLLDKSDGFLMELAADPPGLFDDADEVRAVALIVLQRRLDGVLPCVPGERSTLLADLQASVAVERAIAHLPDAQKHVARMQARAC